jgi:para-aminobenzoate synthetase / 4-amino-4-deoxychorismate lyase
VTAPPPPDPGQGMFETLLVYAGRPIELGAHFARLAASVREVFGVELPAAVAEDARRAARGIDLGRLRVDVGPGGAPGEIDHGVATTTIDPEIFFPPRERGAALRSLSAGGWSGAHKWSDRAWLEAAEAELGEEVPLLVDADGNVLEAGRANLFVVGEGTLATPPLDGRILPGTARAATLEVAAELGIEAVERPVALDELPDADEVFLTSSLRGVRPVRALDGIELRGDGDLVEQLAAGLRERWLGTRTVS